MTDEALEKLIKATADDIEKSLGQIFIGYCGKAVAADKAQTIEESVNFLASCAVKTHPEYAIAVAAYLDSVVAELVPNPDPEKGKWVEKCFDIVAELTREDGDSVVGPEMSSLSGVLIVFENRGTDNCAAVLADEIAAPLKKLNRLYADVKVIHIILDNYVIHTSKITQKAVEKFNGKIVLHFLPPYCPDDNKIERFLRPV